MVSVHVAHPPGGHGSAAVAGRGGSLLPVPCIAYGQHVLGTVVGHGAGMGPRGGSGTGDPYCPAPEPPVAGPS